MELYSIWKLFGLVHCFEEPLDIFLSTFFLEIMTLLFNITLKNQMVLVARNSTPFTLHAHCSFIHIELISTVPLTLMKLNHSGDLFQSKK